MNTSAKKHLLSPAVLTVAFILWTLAVRTIDVQPIGPRGSTVGFAALNGAFHSLTGVHMTLYVITDWLGLIPIAVCFGFAVSGLVQWIRRRRLSKVDADLFVLGGFYLSVIAVYVLFEYIVINRRPVLIDGYLEASYPSSTTLLVLTVMPTAALQWYRRIRQTARRHLVCTVTLAFTAFMTVGRSISGVHWLSDIVGAILLCGALVTLYEAAIRALPTAENHS